MSQKYKPGAFRRQQVEEPIHRIDRADGNEYTKDDFFDCYEQHNEWHAAGLSEQTEREMGEQGIHVLTQYLEGITTSIEFGLSLASVDMIHIIQELESSMNANQILELKAFLFGHSLQDYINQSDDFESLSEHSHQQLLSSTVKFCSTAEITANDYFDILNNINDDLPAIAIHILQQNDNFSIPTILESLLEVSKDRKVVTSKAVMSRLTERVGSDALLDFRKTAVRSFMSVPIDDSETLLRGAIVFYSDFCKVFSKDRESLMDLCSLLDCQSRTTSLSDAQALAEICSSLEGQIDFYYHYVTTFSQENAETCLRSYFNVIAAAERQPAIEPLAQLLSSEKSILTEALSKFVMQRLADSVGADKLKQFRQESVKAFISVSPKDTSRLLQAAMDFYGKFTETFSVDHASLNGLCYMLDCPAKATALSNAVQLSRIASDRNTQISFFIKWIVPFTCNRLIQTVEEYLSIVSNLSNNPGVEPLVALLPPKYELEICTTYNQIVSSTKLSKLSEKEESEKRKYDLLQQLKRETENSRAARTAEQHKKKDRELEEKTKKEELRKKEEERKREEQERKREAEREKAEDAERKLRLIAEEKEKRAKREAKVREEEEARRSQAEAKRKSAEESRLKQKADQEAAKEEREAEKKRQQEAASAAKREKEEAKRLRLEAEAEAHLQKEAKKQQRREEEAANRLKKEQQKLEKQKAERERREAAATKKREQEERQAAARERQEEAARKEAEAAMKKKLEEEQSGSKASEAERLRMEAESNRQKQVESNKSKSNTNTYQVTSKSNKKQQQQQQQQPSRHQPNSNWKYPKQFWEHRPSCVGCGIRLTMEPCTDCC